MALLTLLQLIFLFIPDEKPKKMSREGSVQPPPVVLTPEQIEKRKLAYEKRQRDAAEFVAQEQKRIENEQKLEEQKIQRAIQRRRERSAEAVARDALDDLL